ncbi:alpha/beta fold hydrolase [Sphaerisporangium melleum]|uniref:alpha/beta fold hydrolase n=1 Tax=Sphaerisporangium melleum TaxID=321316 RepID=UPI0035E85F29
MTRRYAGTADEGGTPRAARRAPVSPVPDIGTAGPGPRDGEAAISRRTFAALALGASATTLTRFTPARPAAARRAVRNVVLVHGAYADGSSWLEVIERLQEAGLNVTSVQNPLTSLADDVAATERALALQDGPTVLAGHSWAGTVISQAGLARVVTGLVYAAARAPDAGEDYTALAARYPEPPANAGLVASGGFKQLSERAFLRDFANGVPRRRALALYAAQGRVSDALFTAKTTVAAWRHRPTWYAVSRNDRTTSPDLERFLAARMRATTIELESGHLSIVTHPGRIAALILDATAHRGPAPRRTAGGPHALRREWPV